jgi:transaldolase
MKNYLEWLAQDTPTKWWHDSAIPAEIDAAIANGALGVTTNPVLTYRALVADPEHWTPQVERIPAEVAGVERAEALLAIVAREAAAKFEDVHERTEGRHGYALGQLDPSICSDSERMLAQALRYVSWAPNIAVKLPTVRAALPVIEELAARGVAVCTTLNFSVSQALAAGEAYERGAARARAAGIPVRPCFVVQQGGRLDEYLGDIAQDSGIDIGRDELAQAGNAVCKRAYRLFQDRGISARIMPAGLRGVHHLSAMAGGEVVFSLQARVQRAAIEADLPRVEHIDEEVPATVVARLRRIPEFVRAYDEDGMAPEEFLTFGVNQRTLSQFFWTGWAPLETYGWTGTSDRWF